MAAELEQPRLSTVPGVAAEMPAAEIAEALVTCGTTVAVPPVPAAVPSSEKALAGAGAAAAELSSEKAAVLGVSMASASAQVVPGNSVAEGFAHAEIVPPGAAEISSSAAIVAEAAVMAAQC